MERVCKYIQYPPGIENGFVNERDRVGDIQIEQTSLFDAGTKGQLQLPFSYHSQLAKRQESK